MANVSDFLPNISLVESGGNYTLNVVVSLPAPYEITSVNWDNTSQPFSGSIYPCNCSASQVRMVTVTVDNTGTSGGIMQEQGSVPKNSFTAVQVIVLDASSGNVEKGSSVNTYDQASL